MQHYYLGSFLKMKYFSIPGQSLWFEGGFKSSYLYVRSTEYSRTFQSAMALLTGFLHKSDTFNSTELVHINVESTYTNMCSQKLAGMSCNCPLLERLSKIKHTFYQKYISNSTLYRSIKAQMSRILAVPSEKLPWIGAMLDALMPYACHNAPLPCGSNGCVTWPLVNQMWQFVHNMSASEHGSYVHEKADRLRAYPLLTEICLNLRNVTHGSTNKLTVYSGHDQTLLPILTSLGIFDFEWLPYASRLVFELYRSLYKPVQKIANGTYVLKIVYNGKDKTSQVRMCKTLESGMCRLDDFCGHLENFELQYYLANSYDEACKIDRPK